MASLAPAETRVPALIRALYSEQSPEALERGLERLWAAIKAGADPNQAALAGDLKGIPPIALLAGLGRAGPVRALLALGADPNQARPDGLRALDWAVPQALIAGDPGEAREWLGVVEALLAGGASPNKAPGSDEQEPLAAALNRWEGAPGSGDRLVSLLARFGADPELMIDGKTAERVALESGRLAGAAALAAMRERKELLRSVGSQGEGSKEGSGKSRAL